MIYRSLEEHSMPLDDVSKFLSFLSSLFTDIFEHSENEQEDNLNRIVPGNSVKEASC